MAFSWDDVLPTVAAKGGGAAIDAILGAFGGGGSSDAAAAAQAFSWQKQEEFAKNGISWRVADAKNAGIHPLYALGASIPSFSPSTYVGGESDSGAHWSGVGQDISRAILAASREEDRLDNKLQSLGVERAELENELLRSKIAREKGQIGPPMPPLEPGPSRSLMASPDSGEVLLERGPMKSTESEPGHPWQEPGSINDVGFARTPTGLTPVPSSDVKNRIEDQIIPELMWSFRNNLLPSIGQGVKPPSSWLPDGAVDWKWSLFKQEWQPVWSPEGVTRSVPPRRQIPVRPFRRPSQRPYSPSAPDYFPY